VKESGVKIQGLSAPRPTSSVAGLLLYSTGWLRLTLVAVIITGVSLPLAGLETDQYYAWCHPLGDSGDAINAKLNLELRLTLEELRSRPQTPSCEDVAVVFKSRLHYLIFQDVEIWILKSPAVPRLPATAADELEYRRQNLYHLSGALDIGTWIPSVPTIEIDRIRFGTDKISHFVSAGWRYYRRYMRALAKGLSPEQAEHRMNRIGFFWERTLLGGMSSGVLSLSDMEANYQGMQFYYNLCHGDDPVLELRDGVWEARRALDLRRYITPEWDESYQVPIFSKGRWRKVKPVLAGYCDRRQCAEVVERRAHYQQIDRTTNTEEMIVELRQEGRLADSAQFTLEAVCSQDTAPAPPVAAQSSPAAAPLKPTDDKVMGNTTRQEPQALQEEIYARDQDQVSRIFGLAGLRYSHPEQVAGSFGLMLSRMPSDYDCQTLCAFRGPYLQLQPGLGGGRLSIGWARLVGEKRTNKLILSDIYLGYGFKGAVLHTWGAPNRQPTGQTYLGAEAEFTVVRINFRLGYFRHIGGGEQVDPWLVTWGFGWGF
jgi:hypothetical protein